MQSEHKAKSHSCNAHADIQGECITFGASCIMWPGMEVNTSPMKQEHNVRQVKCTLLPMCAGEGIELEPGNPRLRCPSCQADHCTQCEVDWHEGSSCDKFQKVCTDFNCHYD